MLKSFAGKFIAGVGFGGASYLGYKTYQKKQRHVPLIRFAENDQYQLDLDNYQHKLKSRDDHLKEAQSSDYDVLIIGKQFNSANDVLGSSVKEI